MQSLVLKTVKSDFSAHSGFIWPKSGRVVCPDWNPEPECGGGLHGLLWGEGNSNLLNLALIAKWLVLEVDSEKIVDLGRKVKFPYCNVIYAGERDIAVGLILERNPGAACVYAKKIVGDYGIAHVGDYGEATAGRYGKAYAEHNGAATAGRYGTAITQTYGKSIAGIYGTAITGDYGIATTDECGFASAGFCGTAIAGDGGTATVGNNGEATAGDFGKATAGDFGKATVGRKGRAIVEFGGRAKAGDGGIIMINYNGKRYKYLTGYVGENIKADKFYCVFNGKFEEIS